MYILITYDVSTTTKVGQKRLRRVAKICESYGQRVQNSVFECKMDHAKWVEVKAKLLREMKVDEDSLRFYYLGSQWQKRVEHHGIKAGYNIEDSLIV